MVRLSEPGFVVVYVDNQTIGKDAWFDNVQETSHTLPFLVFSPKKIAALIIIKTKSSIKHDKFYFQTHQTRKMELLLQHFIYCCLGGILPIFRVQ